jgi:hypothetical protein
VSSVTPDSAEQANAALRGLHDWALGHRDRWPSENPFDRVLRLTFTSATKTLGAVGVLTEQGYGADALKLCRSLVESMLVAYWAVFVAEPDWVTSRMEEHQQFAALILIEALEKHPGWLPEGEHVEPPEYAVAERARLTAQFGTYCQESWWAVDVKPKPSGGWKQDSKRSLPTLVAELMEVPELEGRLWQQADDENSPTPFVEQLIDIPNRFNNQILHHNPSGLASYAKLGSEGYEFDDQPSEKWVAQAQVFAYVAFSLLAQLMTDRYAADARETLDQLDPMFISAFLTLSSEQLTFARRGANRNQPCPCGSGLKCKRCHGARS